MEELGDVYSYLDTGAYPEGLSKYGKQNWRRKCKENFKIENGQLFHKEGDRRLLKETQTGAARTSMEVVH